MACLTFKVKANNWDDTNRLDLKKNGCYVLSETREKGYRTISRIGREDHKGILYIGMSDNMAVRIKSLMDSTKCNYILEQKMWKEKGHKTFSKKFFRSRKHINFNNLQITAFSSDLPIARSLESYLLESYVAKYGELPPFNGQYGSFSLNEAREHLKGLIDLDNFDDII